MANPMTPPEELLERIEKLRQRQKPRLQETTVTMVHGAGGKATHALVEARLFRGIPQSHLGAIRRPSDF
ncbi:MAG: hypothetical protein BKPUNTRY_001547 [Candidatus Fervidibacter sp.]